MLTSIQKKPEWSFYLLWVVLTLLCIPTAFFIDLMILRVITSFVGDFIIVNGIRHITEDYLAMYPFILVAGLLTGGFQYVLLRQYLPRMGWWVLATAGGWLLGALLIALTSLFHWAEMSTNIDLIFSVMGLSIGFGQWLLLRQRLPKAGWWIPANIAGWYLLALITPGNSIGQFGLFLLGFLPACLTAAALALLMNQSISSETNTG